MLHDVSFDVKRGEAFALLGGNGAGKSTTLLTLLGFLKPASGTAQIHGHDVAQQVDEVRKITAYLPEAASLYGHLSATENLAYFAARMSARKRQLNFERNMGAEKRVGMMVTAKKSDMSAPD